MPRTSATPSPRRRWRPGSALPLEGTVLISVNDYDKGAGAQDRPRPAPHGLQAVCHPRHGRHSSAGPACRSRAVNKVAQGSPHMVDLIRAGQGGPDPQHPLGPNAHTDGAEIRTAATAMDVPLLTTLSPRPRPSPPSRRCDRKS